MVFNFLALSMDCATKSVSKRDYLKINALETKAYQLLKEHKILGSTKGDYFFLLPEVEMQKVTLLPCV